MVIYRRIQRALQGNEERKIKMTENKGSVLVAPEGKYTEFVELVNSFNDDEMQEFIDRVSYLLKKQRPESYQKFACLMKSENQ